MHDALVCGCRFHMFNTVDDFSREASPIEIDLNLPTQQVVHVFDRIATDRGYPATLRLGNGPEFISLALAERVERHAVKLGLIQPGKPTQNAFIERFNWIYRTGIFDFYLFRIPNEVRGIAEKWSSKYNCERPYEPLNNMTPGEYRQRHYLAGVSKSVWNQSGSIYTAATVMPAWKASFIHQKWNASMEDTLSAGKQCGQRCLIVLNMIAVTGDDIVGMAVSLRNNLKTRTLSRAASMSRGQD